MTPSGVVTVLHAFPAGRTGRSPPRLSSRPPTETSGTTQAGGASGNGTVFKMTPSGTVTVL